MVVRLGSFHTPVPLVPDTLSAAIPQPERLENGPFSGHCRNWNPFGECARSLPNGMTLLEVKSYVPESPVPLDLKRDRIAALQLIDS
jgi:hypothetical protein